MFLSLLVFLRFHKKESLQSSNIRSDDIEEEEEMEEESEESKTEKYLQVRER